MKEERLRQLFEGWLHNQLSVREQAEWMDLLVDPTLESVRQQIIENYYDQLPMQYSMEPEVAEALFRSILPESTPPKRVRIWSDGWRRYIAAAAIIGIVALTGILWWARRNVVSESTVAANVYENDVKPGGDHAVLTLANGAHIMLDSAGKGNLVSQGGAQLIKADSGNLTYKAMASDDNAISYNTLATPAGGQYQVTLSDGTRVWLNALSSIRFPATFKGGSRSVNLTGEAYFEVAKDKMSPFHVNANGVDVQVLGTEFNVNAYADEPGIKTTLVRGAVRLSKANATLLLKPGEEGQTSGTSGLVLDKDVNIDRTLAWKNGKFSFEGADIRTIMRQIGRWYNVEVRYLGDPGNYLFDGQIGRDLNLSEVLTGLSKSNVHFKINGNVLTVLP
jgi:ferric-dicitrate binding protein FerR (iron transport regulator)